MLQKAASAAVDHVFCDLEDSVAPNMKVQARMITANALNSLQWACKTRCVRINDVTTPWCYEDVVTLLEQAGRNIDTIMLTKPMCASDVMFLHHLLTQLEKKLRLERRIGIEVLIEEVQALQNVEEIARCSDRLECLVFGMGDYSGSQGIDTAELAGTGEYPGDIFHYARFRITMAARAAGIDAVDGPYANFKNAEAYRAQALRARSLGMSGKWAIHPSQIQLANEIFSPSVEEVARARKWEAIYREAEAKGLGAVQVDGIMLDVAVLRLVRNTLDKAHLFGM
jgi:citrate lyase subunit beta/citryl-CoA lyase